MAVFPIRTSSDHARAVARIADLIGAAAGTPEGDELDVLATLVDAYEARHEAIDAPDPVSAIVFRMEQQQLTRKDLEPMIGSRARVSEILNAKRDLTLNMVRQLRSGLGISADLLVGPIALGQASGPTKSRKTKSRKTKARKQHVSIAAKRRSLG